MWLLVLGIIPLVVVSFVGYWVMSRSVREAAGQRLMAVAAGVATRIDEQVRDLVRATGDALPGLASVDPAPRAADWRSDSAALVAAVLNRPLSRTLSGYQVRDSRALDLLLVVDSTGWVLAASGPFPQPPYQVAGPLPLDPAAVPASELHYVRERDWLEVTAPLSISGHTAGHIIGAVRLATLGPAVEDAVTGQTGFAALVNNDGEVLLLPASRTGFLPRVPADRQSRLGAGYPGWLRGRRLGGRGGAVVALAPVPATGALARAGMNSGWTVSVEQAETEILAPVTQFGRTAIFVFLLTAAIVMVAGLLLSDRVVRPRRDQRHGAGRIGARDHDLVIDLATGDEIEELAAEFNAMAHRLKESRSGLEEKVRAATAELKRQRDSLQSILTAVGEGLMVVDTDHRVLAWNPAAVQMTGYSPAEAQNRTCQELLHTASSDGEICQRLCPVEQALAERRTVTSREADIFLNTKLGARLPVSVTASPLLDEQDRPRGCVVVLRDVSREREVDRFKSEMTSTVAHELRTPLGPIIGFAELLRETRLPDDQRDKYLRIIVEQGRRLAGLVDNFLALSRIETGRLELNLQPVDLAAVVEEIVAIEARHNPGHQLASDLPAHFPPVRGDFEWLKRVVHNLVSNAIKYSPGGGPVRVSGRDLGREVELSVTDSGIGIREEDLPRLFHRFTRVNREATPDVAGTGLGLSICRHVVTEHGGTILVRSEYGKGSTFTVRLPKTGPAGA